MTPKIKADFCNFLLTVGVTVEDLWGDLMKPTSDIFTEDNEQYIPEELGEWFLARAQEIYILRETLLNAFSVDAESDAAWLKKRFLTYIAKQLE